MPWRSTVHASRPLGTTCLKTKPSPNLPSCCQTLGKKRKRWFQVILLQDLYAKYLPLPTNTCPGSSSSTRQPDLKSLAGLGMFVILAHADLQLENVYLDVKGLWSNKLWWIQHIVFSSFFGMLFASWSHGEHIFFFLCLYIWNIRHLEWVCSPGMSQAVLALQADCLKIMIQYDCTTLQCLTLLWFQVANSLILLISSL